MKPESRLLLEPRDNVKQFCITWQQFIAFLLESSQTFRAFSFASFHLFVPIIFIINFIIIIIIFIIIIILLSYKHWHC